MDKTRELIQRNKNYRPKITIYTISNSTDEFNSELNASEEKFSKLENRSEKNRQKEAWQEKIVGKISLKRGREKMSGGAAISEEIVISEII